MVLVVPAFADIVDQYIQAALNNTDYSLRYEAVEAQAETKDPRAVDPLIQILDGDDGMQEEAAFALGRIKDTRAIGPLIESLDTENQYIRMAAIWALTERLVNPQ
jgi:HEAT repeat protein